MRRHPERSRSLGEVIGDGLLAIAVQVATRCSPAAKRYYEQLASKKHKHVARVARVARAHKLLIAVYALPHDGVVFDEKKFAAV